MKSPYYYVNLLILLFAVGVLLLTQHYLLNQLKKKDVLIKSYECITDVQQRAIDAILNGTQLPSDKESKACQEPLEQYLHH